MRSLLLVLVFLIAPLCTLQSLMYRYDARCGEYYPTEDGQPAKCDPDSDYYCCSTEGWCGNSWYHCECDGCVNYRELEKGFRYDGRCGSEFPLADGEPSRCNPDSLGPCCSYYGWCGNGPDYCACDKCIDFRELEQGVRSDGRCGPWFPLDNGQPSKCDAYSGSPCCSEHGWCGSGSEYCTCNDCINYSELEKDVRSDGRCGDAFPLENGKPGKCDPDSSGPCCSYDGWCGGSDDHCNCGDSCTDYRELERGVRGDGRCGSYFPLKNGQPGPCDPLSDSPCCSSSGWCGDGEDYCACYFCYDFRVNP